MEAPLINKKGSITTTKQKDIDINRINRSYYLNLFSASAEKNFKWN